jgi:hypothetical protein
MTPFEVSLGGLLTASLSALDDGVPVEAANPVPHIREALRQVAGGSVLAG